MKKHILLIVILGLSLCGLLAQTAPATPAGGFRNVQSYVEKEAITIELKALIPASDEFREKADTYQKAGEYNFTFDKESMRENSEILLNKWLKESK
jgi:hypothetical protein